MARNLNNSATYSLAYFISPVEDIILKLSNPEFESVKIVGVFSPIVPYTGVCVYSGEELPKPLNPIKNKVTIRKISSVIKNGFDLPYEARKKSGWNHYWTEVEANYKKLLETQENLTRYTKRNGQVGPVLISHENGGKLHFEFYTVRAEDKDKITESITNIITPIKSLTTLPFKGWKETGLNNNLTNQLFEDVKLTDIEQS